jgi:hypothetical protein
MDGRSMVELLRGNGGAGFSNGRSVVLEYGRERDKAGLVCEYAGIRDPSHVYVEYTAIATGTDCLPIEEGELYDLAADPLQLNNLYLPNGGQGSVQSQLQAKLEQLRACAGIAGRDPQPASGSYCE